MTRKEILRRIALGAAAALALALLILTLALHPSRTLIGGWYYRRNETVLDLSGEKLRSNRGLLRLNRPEKLDLRGCRLSAGELIELAERFPDCEIRCEVPVGNERIDNFSESLTLSECREELLILFPRLRTLELRDVLPEEAERSAFARRHPALTVLYTREAAAGHYFPFDCTEMDLSGCTDFRLSALARRLPEFPQLRRLVLTGCGFEQESLLLFRSDLPDIEVVWDIPLYGKTFLSTDREIDLSGQWIAKTEELEAALPCFSELETVILCNCGISDEDMDALGRRYENIRFLWEVHFGVFHLRTDTTRFLALAWENGYTWLSDEQLVPLSYCRDMVALDLGHMWFSDTTFLRDMTHLRWLILADNRIKDISSLANLQELEYLELFLCDVTDISPLLSCRNLKYLNLAYCPVKNAELLAQLPSLERLWVNGCPISYAALRTIREALPNIEINTVGEESTGQGWRKHPSYYEMRDAFGAAYME